MIAFFCIEVPLNDIISIPNLMKIYQAVQKLLMGTGRQTVVLISLLSILESRLRMQVLSPETCIYLMSISSTF
jgi:hypothetical protein